MDIPPNVHEYQKYLLDKDYAERLFSDYCTELRILVIKICYELER